MELSEFLKLKQTLDSQVNKIVGLKIVQKNNSIAIAIEQNIQIQTVKDLLQLLRENKVAFAIYDSFYPSPSDPGAYIDYSHEKGDNTHTWSMTLGNHGWTGGHQESGMIINSKMRSLIFWMMMRKIHKLLFQINH